MERRASPRSAETDRLVVWHRWLPPRKEAKTELDALARWRRTVAARLRVAGGAVLGAIGASVAAAFDPADTADVVDVCLDLLDEAEGTLEVAIGVAVGRVIDDDEGLVGEAIERAQLLANRARPGEVVLDPPSRERVTEDFLFGRQVAAGAGAPRGITIDRTHPRRQDCAEAIAALHPPALPPNIATVRDAIGRALSDGTSRTFVLRGPVGAGATELIADLASAIDGVGVWKIGAAPGGVVPLASLRLSLLRRLGTPEAVRTGFDLPGPAAVLSRVAAGELVSRYALSKALAALVRAENEAGRRPWVMLSPLGLIDGATFGALLEVRAVGGDFVLFGRLPMDSALPRPLDELDEPVEQLVLPPLKMADALVVAEAVLGPETSSDVVRRVAVLGGDTVLGVVEAARTLVASGDLVRQGERFVWRTGPRSGAAGIGTAEVLSERLELIDADSRRVLEALCVVPDGSPRELLEQVADLDGVRAGPAFARCLTTLRREALARGKSRPRPASSLLRWRVLSLIPPSRSMELHRYVGEAVEARAGEHVPLRVEHGYFLVEGGLEERGKGVVREALEPLLTGGYERAARQISGWLSALEDRSSGPSHSRHTPTPPPIESHEEGPPSAEIPLDELLEEAERRSRPPPPTTTKAPLPPPARPTPPSGAAAIPRVAAPSPPPEPPAREVLPPPPPTADLRAIPRAAEPLVDPRSSFQPGVSTRPAREDETDRIDLPMGFEDAGPPAPPALPPPEPRVTASSSTTPSNGHRDLGLVDEPPPAEVLDDEVDALFATAMGSARAASPPPAAPLSDPTPSQLDGEVDALLGAPVEVASEVVSQTFSVEERTSVAPAPVRPLDDGERSARSARSELSETRSSGGLGGAAPQLEAPEAPQKFVDAVVRALRDRDFDALERAIERGEAEGADLGAIGRVRALAELARGDLESARKRLREAEDRGKDEPAAKARSDLAGALLELHAGDPAIGVRAALASLAVSRRRGDDRGARAALYALAACYLALGDEEAARRLRPAS